jgi:hypothetical protein
LAFYKEVFLPKVHDRIADGSIAVRVVLHSAPDDVCHFVEPPVIHLLHGMQNAALYGF